MPLDPMLFTSFDSLLLPTRIKGTSEAYVYRKHLVSLQEWNPILIRVKDKGKVIPLQSRCGPECG